MLGWLSERLRLPLESCDAIGVTRDGFRNDLERNVAAEPRIAGTIDLAHATLAQFRKDFIRSEPGA